MHKPTALSFIKALLILLIFIVGCSGNPLEDVSDFASGIEAKEAPMWAKQVAAGKLPPLEERLPENPLVAKTNFDGYERTRPLWKHVAPVPHTSGFRDVEDDSRLCPPHPLEI